MLAEDGQRGVAQFVPRRAAGRRRTGRAPYTAAAWPSPGGRSSRSTPRKSSPPSAYRPAIVEVAETFAVDVDRLDHRRALDVLAPVRRRRACRADTTSRARRSSSGRRRSLLGEMLRAAGGTSCISWMSMPNSGSRSCGSGLKNVHWSPSKSVRSVPPSAASGSSTACVQQLDQDVRVAVRLRIVAIVRRATGGHGRCRGRVRAGSAFRLLRCCVPELALESSDGHVSGS